MQGRQEAPVFQAMAARFRSTGQRDRLAGKPAQKVRFFGRRGAPGQRQATSSIFSSVSTAGRQEKAVASDTGTGTPFRVLHLFFIPCSS